MKSRGTHSPVLIKKYKLTFEQGVTELIRRLTSGVISISFIVLPSSSKTSIFTVRSNYQGADQEKVLD